MCVIVTGRERKPTLEILKQCEKQNGHGSGMAWVTRNGDVMYRKDVSPEAMMDLLDGLKTAPWALHFRLATVGGKSAELCHPFPIEASVPLAKEGRAERVLFHNGHWPDWDEHGLKEILRWGHEPLDHPISDTRAIAWMVHHRGVPILNWVPGKFVVLDKSGAQLFPRSKEGWSEHEGCWYSNLFWQPYSSKVTTPYQGSACGYHYRHDQQRTVADETAPKQLPPPPDKVEPRPPLQPGERLMLPSKDYKFGEWVLCAPSELDRRDAGDKERLDLMAVRRMKSYSQMARAIQLNQINATFSMLNKMHEEDVKLTGFFSREALLHAFKDVLKGRGFVKKDGWWANEKDHFEAADHRHYPYGDGVGYD